MFRLHEKQLHMITGLLVLVSVVMFFFLAMPELKQSKSIVFHSMDDFSEGWICKYSSTNAEVLKKYYSEDEILEGKNKVEEIFQLPFVLDIEEGKKIELTNKIPQMAENEIGYLQIETDAEKITVYVGKNCLYKSSEMDDKVKALHLIEIPSKYQDSVVRIVMKKESATRIKVAPILFGNDSQVFVSAFQYNGAYFIAGVFGFLLCVCVIAVQSMLKVKKERKTLLTYVELETIVISFLFLLESRIFTILTSWNYSVLLLKACFSLIAIALHLLVVRYVLSHKKVCLFVDFGISLVGMVFISVVVLQAFELVSFSIIYLIGIVMFLVLTFLYTLLMFRFVGKNGTLDIWWMTAGNIVLLLGFAAFFLMPLIQKTEKNHWYIGGAFLIYIAIAFYRGLNKATFEKKEIPKGNDEDEIRQQVVDQMNPNLLFASLHTLQKMIKNNSDKSIKMLYYISVYFRGNLLALEKQDEIITFEQELEHIIAYLQLQQSRNQEFKYTVECKEKRFLIPRNSIEPMVENAVKYGIGGNNNRGNVVVRSYQRSDGYAIQIIDDGIGFDVNTLKRSSRTALLNLFDKLKKNCGSNIEVVSKEGKGTVITLVLPMLENELLQERQDGEKDE